ncbi:acetyl-CoA synthetase-like protein [Aspergillus steynii IBT 23096]|uniref:Acetyl-CoA synthetase-like protein n=1 Tax=Aspergillus steynii IBT 23096 TaxID=1392250 RepID=A0A2I2GH55_9EURO|nr:acetyl-CoA synthetase-like protein [Aspergillus steynii IBT 23096]PLB52210.1 acetyl-CoA synthetase-like protein [Aspergillus steynii IBT 23096]
MTDLFLRLVVGTRGVLYAAATEEHRWSDVGRKIAQIAVQKGWVPAVESYRSECGRGVARDSPGRVGEDTEVSVIVPTSLPIWDFIFDSDYSPLRRVHPTDLGAFVNAATAERIRYDEVKDYATYISTALVRDHGLQKGDTVAMFSPNTIWYPVALLATARAGGIVSGASPAYNVEEMSYALTTGKAKYLLTVPSSLAVAIPAAKNAGIPADRILLLEGEQDGYTNVQKLLEIGKEYGDDGQVSPFKFADEESNRDLCGFLSFSSGTTGLPKAEIAKEQVMITHHNVMAQCMQIQQIVPPDYKKTLAVLPLFHITGLVHLMHLPILLNTEVFMLPSFNMTSMLNTVVDNKITELLLVPPILVRLLQDPTAAKFDLSHVKTFTSGAAPMAEGFLQKLENRYPWTGFKQAYGMTESCSCITMHPFDKQSYQYAHHVGTIVANTEVKILDPKTGREMGYNELGEILARGPQVVMGYLDNVKATRETFDAEGWLHTGDIGFMDEEGFLTITDRIKEMIKVKGIGVSPAELEDLLLGRNDVADAAVTAIPDDYSGERPKAYVVLQSSEKERVGDGFGLVDIGRDIIEYVRAKKVRHKWIVEVEFVKEIPKSASGKILRRVLRDMEKKGTSGKRLVVRDERVKAKL